MIESREFRSLESINDAYLWGLLKHSTAIISRARELELAHYKITMEQMSILHALLINDGSAAIDEIAAIIVRQHNSVSTIVSRMSKQGLVKKEKLPHEKKYRVQITDKARKIVVSMPWKSIEMIFAGLSLNEKKQLATYLEQLVSAGHNILGHNNNLPFLSNES